MILKFDAWDETRMYKQSEGCCDSDGYIYGWKSAYPGNTETPPRDNAGHEFPWERFRVHPNNIHEYKDAEPVPVAPRVNSPHDYTGLSSALQDHITNERPPDVGSKIGTLLGLGKAKPGYKKIQIVGDARIVEVTGVFGIRNILKALVDGTSHSERFQLPWVDSNPKDLAASLEQETDKIIILRNNRGGDTAVILRNVVAFPTGVDLIVERMPLRRVTAREAERMV